MRCGAAAQLRAAQGAGQTRGRDPATFRDHVLGRVAWATSLDPAFGARLSALADRIDWSAGAVG
jgi:hypothetical protein